MPRKKTNELRPKRSEKDMTEVTINQTTIEVAKPPEQKSLVTVVVTVEHNETKETKTIYVSTNNPEEVAQLIINHFISSRGLVAMEAQKWKITKQEPYVKQGEDTHKVEQHKIPS